MINIELQKEIKATPGRGELRVQQRQLRHPRSLAEKI